MKKDGEPVERGSIIPQGSCKLPPRKHPALETGRYVSLSDSYVPATLSLAFPVWYDWLPFQLEESDTGKATPWDWRAFSCSPESKELCRERG